jgi:hypothetical protein
MIFPQSHSLPSLLHSDNWNWYPPTGDLPFWLGEDAERRRWLVKMRGGFYAVRERAFAIIAQALDISCQSVPFLKIPRKNLADFTYPNVPDTCQLAILFFEEHKREACSNLCALAELNSQWRLRPYDIDVLINSKINKAIDIARGAMLGMLCEMHEPPDFLFTQDHTFIQIDNEMMFSRSSGAYLWDSPWVVDDDGRRKPAGIVEAIKLCKAVLALPDDVYAEAIRLPAGYRPKMNWSVKREVAGIRPRAEHFLNWAK